MADNRQPADRLSFAQRILIRLEDLIMSRLVPLDGPGPVFSLVFKMPILFYRLGLWHLAGPFIMIVHKGRKTGKIRYTPLEYSHELETDSYLLMAGWRGHTDWYRNLRANPYVHAQVGRRAFDAIAEPMTDEEAAQQLIKILAAVPSSAKMLSRWTDGPLDSTSPQGLLRAGRDFPCVRLKPISK